MRCSRHGTECAFAAEAQRTFDEWMEAEKRFVRGEVTHRQLHELEVAYRSAREARLRECEGVETQEQLEVGP